jgi:hypothetical protein
VAGAARERLQDQPGLLRHPARLVEHAVQLLVLERTVNDLRAHAPQVWLPLLDAVALARVAVVDARDDGEKTHNDRTQKSEV